MGKTEARRRLPAGAEWLPGEGVHFRIWATNGQRVRVLLDAGPGQERAEVELEPEGAGYFSALVPGIGPGTRYQFQLDGGGSYPDPASRFQPDGPHGASQVIDPAEFSWTDSGWPGLKVPGLVIYELHVGTFTRQGTWEAAARELPELADLGVTAVEVMPVAEFPGRFGWGYDGVDLFAPTRLYGAPDDFRRFVDRAHAAGLGVILDVVYNHLGPDGAYHRVFSPDYYKKEGKNDWGDSLNFDGENCGPVREFFVANAGYWIDEFHVDGLRLDATHAIHDSSGEHVLVAIGKHARAVAARQGRSVVLIAENDDQIARLVRPLEEGGYGLDVVWNDDFHHSAAVAVTKRAEGYYSDFLGTPQELISALKWGYLFQGQYYHWKKTRRGTPTFGIPSSAFMVCLENHDQVSNSARGDRLTALTSPGLYKAMTALMLLAPGTPMLFQGQEFAASSPFLYFADHEPELAQKVKEGRAEFLGIFESIAHPEIKFSLPDPSDPATFEASKLDLSERKRHEPIYHLHRDLLRLRREDPVFRSQRGDRMHGAVISPETFLLRFFGDSGDDRLVIVNLGRDLYLASSSEPLLAPPEGAVWGLLWYSEALRYGGCWAPPLQTENHWRIPGHAAVVLKAERPRAAD